MNQYNSTQQIIEFKDHRAQKATFVRVFLIFFGLLPLVIFAPTFWFIYESGELEPIFLLVFGPMAFAFAIVPFILMKVTMGKHKKTRVLTNEKKVQFYVGKDFVSEIHFSEIEEIKQSRYTYTVKTKNGSSTVTVFTTILPKKDDQIISENTNFHRARLDAELIAKTVRIPLINEEGKKRDLDELDIPFHRRPHPDYEELNPPNFEKASQLTWADTGTEFVLTSRYSPFVFKFVAIVLSFIIFLILQTAIGDLLGVSIFDWQTFPPTISESIFSLIVLALALFPISFVFYYTIFPRTFKINKEEVAYGSKKIKLDSLEEVILDAAKLRLIGDQITLDVGLTFFCANDQYSLVRDAVVFGILSKSSRGESSSFSKFETEF